MSPAQKLMVASPRNIGAPFVTLAIGQSRDAASSGRLRCGVLPWLATLMSRRHRGYAICQDVPGKRTHRIVKGIGHNLPQGAPPGFAGLSSTLAAPDRHRSASAARRDAFAGVRTMERRPHHSLAELLQQDQYTPEEVAE